MDFSWTGAQLARRAQAVEFGRTRLSDPGLTDRDREGVFDREAWQRCAEFGIQGLSVPAAYGGEDIDLLTAMLVMEGLGEGCPDNGLTLALNTQLWTVQYPIVRFGTEDQKERFLPDFCAGRSLGAHALTEADSGSDAFSLAMRAEPCDGGYRLTGTKRLITLGPVADVVLVFANVAPEKGPWGVTAFLVERSAEGYTASPMQHKMGLRTVPIGEIALEDCFVPEANRLGPEGGGVSISKHSLEVERCCILASQLGAMERQLARSVDRAVERKQFGKPIGQFQSVSNRIADMKLRLEMARLLLYKTAWMVDHGQPALMEAALLKLYLAEAFVDSGLDAIRIHGGIGYLTETEVERDLRDAIGGVLYAGTSDIQRNIIARLLGVGR